MPPHGNPPMNRTAFSLLASIVLTTSFGAAQRPGRFPVDTPQPQQREEGGGLLPGSPFRTLFQRGDVPPVFDGTDTNARRFRGFPSLAPESFGSYPGGRLPLPFDTRPAGPPPEPTPPRSKNAWPSWLDAEGDGFTSSVAILAQSSDYVWVKDPEETVYTPLAPYDRYRVVHAGTEVDVRGGGHFQAYFHGGAVVRVLGRSHLAMVLLDDDVADLRFDALSHVFAFARERLIRIRIGDGAVVDLRNARVSFDRQLDGSVLCTNETRGEVSLDLNGQRIELKNGRRVRLLPGVTGTVLASELSFEGEVRVVSEGRVARATGVARGGTVTWSGARFRIPGGGVLRIDPLSGMKSPASSIDNP